MHLLDLATKLRKFSLPEKAYTGGFGNKKEPGQPKKNLTPQMFGGPDVYL